MAATGRRLLSGRVRLARRSWVDVAPELEFFLNRLWESEANGLPAGFNNITPERIEAGVVGSPGTQASGWAGGDHVHAILTDVPVDIGFANAEGTSSALARADHVHKLGPSVLDEAFIFPLIYRRPS